MATAQPIHPNIRLRVTNRTKRSARVLSCLETMVENGPVTWQCCIACLARLEATCSQMLPRDSSSHLLARRPPSSSPGWEAVPTYSEALPEGKNSMSLVRNMGSDSSVRVYHPLYLSAIPPSTLYSQRDLKLQGVSSKASFESC